MLDSDDRWHKNVDLMTMHFKRVISEQLGDAVVGFHDLRLRVFVSRDDHDSCIISEHHVKVVLLLVVRVRTSIVISLFLPCHRFRSLHHLCLGNKLLALSCVILDLHEIVTVNLQCFRVVVVDSRELNPYLIDSFRVVNDVEP